MVNISNLTDVYGVFAYKDPLLDNAIENFLNWRHREVAIQQDPIAKIYICKLDQEILVERPVFTPDIFGGGSEDTSEEGADTALEGVVSPAEDSTAEDVSEEWETERWDNLLLKMFDMARTHAFCVVQLYDRKPYWRVFTDREIQEIQYDKNDNPIGCKVEWTKQMHLSTKLRFHKETLRFFDETRTNNDGTALLVPFGDPIGQNIGEYDLHHLWSLIVWLRYINLDIVNNSAKSSGFYHLKYGDALTSSERDNLVNAMDIAGGMRAVGAKESALAEIIAMYPPNSQFSIEAAEALMLLVAGASRLPLSFYRGERESGGMNSGMAGFVDEGKVTEKKKQVFKSFTTYIKKLVEMRWGIVIEDVVPYIESEQNPVEMESFEMGKNKENNKEEEKPFGK